MLLITTLVSVLTAHASTAPPREPWHEQGEAMAARAVEFLRARQDSATGGWSVPPKDSGRPNLPAITALALRGMMQQPGVDAKDPAVTAAVRYILSFAKPDGGIYDGMLPSYNTAICLSALAHVDTPEARKAIGPAQEFLKRSQWGTTEPVGVGGAGGKEAPTVVDEKHPFYGGLGYGNRGRPDLSNLAFAIEAWRESGLPVDDPAFKRAIVFLERCQMIETAGGTTVNPMPYAKGSRQGGFIYATAENDKTIGQGQSFAGTIEESMDDGSKVSRLRAYGSMTYAGFKSYIYAGLSRSDPRVQAALGWMSRNYTLLENPHMGSDGYYYFLVMFGRAMAASELDLLPVTERAPLRASLLLTPQGDKAPADAAGVAALLKDRGVPAQAIVARAHSYIAYYADEAGADKARQALASAPLIIDRTDTTRVGASADWRKDLVEHLALLQNPDGSFKSLDDRWMENDPSLVTSYALVALQSALRPANPAHP
ncbi:MAG: hypothetical protein KIT68_05640 [Phycisphaeraceae bacterium]|nr:hypothetical protein [Phycisphaeraceae bacterium]